ncbi:MAG: tetratricopeptide (TPR) repeat protein, partial [Akkermansiaceae bacterium]
MKSLRWLYPCALILITPALALSGPELTIRDTRDRTTRLAIESFKTKVLFFEDLAQTTITVTFRSSISRITEGEFAIPLPPGATISGYALDVNGEMRESSVVEKERARFAYESIKRKKIDPGFIEREEGNVYRTKIFPIPGNGTKSVRLSYCEIIEPKEGHLDYHLLLPQVKIDDCRIVLEHLKGRPMTIVKEGDLNLEVQLPGFYRADAKGQILPPELVIRVEKPKDAILVKAGGYSYSRRVPKPAPNATPLAGNTTAFELVWDCSESRRGQDHSPEFDLLDQLFEKHPDLTVRLTLLRLTSERGGDFKIRNGEWRKLRQSLEAIFYDGATDLAAYQPTDLPAFLFTDGQSHFSFLGKPWTQAINLVDQSGNAHPYWKKQTQESGGVYLSLTQPNPLAPSTNPVRKFARLKEVPPPQDVDSRDPLIQKLIAILWAQEELRSLESELLPNREKIIAHCKKHHLVSDHTSLIVLDRYADYLAYKIPPPEPELRKRYDESIAGGKSPRVGKELINYLWSSRQRWHGRSFPWHESVIYPTLMRLAVWKKSLVKTFDPGELNSNNLEKISAWEKELGSLLSEKKDFETDEAFQAWLGRVAKLQQREFTLQELTIGKVTEDKRMAIAVNGLVRNSGKFSVNNDLTLLKAIEKAGGVSPFGSSARISIYRNAIKTTYNTLSAKFCDIALQAGDLIVVEPKPSEIDMRNDADPFAADAEPKRSRSIDHRKAPAIVENFSNPPFSEYFNTSGGAGGGDPFGGRPPEPDSGGVGFALPVMADSPTPVMDSLKKALKEKPTDPDAIYRQFRPGNRYPDHFYLEIGDLLLTQKQPALARRALSNLIEGPSPRPAAYRKFAFLLVKHGDHQGALDLLDRISRYYPDDQVIALDQAWIAAKLNQSKVAELHLKRATRSINMRRSRSETLAEIAIAESNQPSPGRTLPLDLRIVVVTASGQSLELAVSEPINTVAFFHDNSDT